MPRTSRTVALLLLGIVPATMASAALQVFESNQAYTKGAVGPFCPVGTENFDESNLGPGAPAVVLGDPLLSYTPSLAGGLGFPAGLTLPQLRVMSNMGPNPGPPIPNPRGEGGLVALCAGLQGAQSEIVAAAVSTDSLDLVLEGGSHRGVGFNIFSLGGGSQVVITVYDRHGAVLFQGMRATMSFFGAIESSDVGIGRINVFDPTGGLEAIDDIEMWDARDDLSFNFEPSLYSGSAAGVSVTGQDDWYVPIPTATGGLVMTYAGNAYGLNGNSTGESQFLAMRAPGMTQLRSEHHACFSCMQTICYDVIARYNGTPPALPATFGRFSIQHADTGDTNNTFAQANTWVLPGMPVAWNATYLAYDETGAPFAPPGLAPGMAWTGLLPNRWYRLCTSVDFDHYLITRTSITDLTTNITTTVSPVDWHLSPGGSLPHPNALRFAVDGANPGNIQGWDNVTVELCRCDVNDNCIVDSQDFFDFLTAFFQGSDSADFNQDGAVTSQDFFDFLVCFFGGC